MLSPHEAFARFLEATRRAKLRKSAEREGRKLEAALKKAFRVQGNLLVQGMRKQLRQYFAESHPYPPALSPNARAAFGEREPFEQHAQFLNMPLEESVSENEWLPIWIEVTQATAKLFRKPIDEAVAQAMEIGALAAIGDVKMDIRFDLANPRAVRYLDEYGAKLVSGLDDETQKDLRKLISQAVDKGWSWSKLEDAILANYEQYSTYRAHLIAITEIGQAYSEGNLIIAKDLQAAGLEMEKAWDPAGDGCAEICAPNADQGWIALDEPFQSGHQRPLDHPGCWCDMLTRRKGSES